MAVTEFYRLREGLPTHLTVHDPVPVPVGRLICVHLLLGHLGQLLSQLPPALRHLDGRGQEHEVLDEPDHQALAVHLQQGLEEGVQREAEGGSGAFRMQTQPALPERLNVCNTPFHCD